MRPVVRLLIFRWASTLLCIYEVLRRLTCFVVVFWWLFLVLRHMHNHCTPNTRHTYKQHHQRDDYFSGHLRTYLHTHITRISTHNNAHSHNAPNRIEARAVPVSLALARAQWRPTLCTHTLPECRKSPYKFRPNTQFQPSEHTQFSTNARKSPYRQIKCLSVIDRLNQFTRRADNFTLAADTNYTRP